VLYIEQQTHTWEQVAGYTAAAAGAAAALFCRPSMPKAAHPIQQPCAAPHLMTLMVSSLLQVMSV
jgi:hypothetical protein